jgi:hypothetical protein
MTDKPVGHDACPQCGNDKNNRSLGLDMPDSGGVMWKRSCGDPWHDAVSLPQPPLKYRPLAECRRALAESVEQRLRYTLTGNPSSLLPWEERVQIIEQAMFSYEKRVLAEAASLPVERGAPQLERLVRANAGYNAEELAAHPLSKEAYPPFLPKETEAETVAARFYEEHPDFWIHPLAGSTISGDKDRATIRVHKAMAAFQAEDAARKSQPASVDRGAPDEREKFEAVRNLEVGK